MCLFPDSSTNMDNSRGHLEDNNLEMSQSQEDGQSQASVSTVTFGDRRLKNHHRKDLNLSELSSDDDGSEDGGSHHSPRQSERVEQDSLQ